MTDWVLNLAWACTPGLVTGVVMAFFNRGQKKRDEAASKAAAALERETILNLNLTFAAAQLAYATAIALKRGAANGEVEQGVATYEEALAAYRQFERQQISELRKEH